MAPVQMARETQTANPPMLIFLTKDEEIMGKELCKTTEMAKIDAHANRNSVSDKLKIGITDPIKNVQYTLWPFKRTSKRDSRRAAILPSLLHLDFARMKALRLSGVRRALRSFPPQHNPILLESLENKTKDQQILDGMLKCA